LYVPLSPTRHFEHLNGACLHAEVLAAASGRGNLIEKGEMVSLRLTGGFSLAMTIP
jgi:hypothetical protein